MIGLTPLSANAATILVVGDSISTAYKMKVEEGWVHLLEQRLNSGASKRHQVVNISVSGETTGAGKARLPSALKTHAPDLVILELGGNDGLRGHPIERIRANLSAMIAESKSAGSDVLLLGMRLPPNYGQRYAQAFASLYEELASNHAIALVPFFLDSVATNASFMQVDGIHPQANAQQQLLDNIWPSLMRWFKSNALFL